MAVSWKTLLRNGIRNPWDLASHVPLAVSAVASVAAVYPMRINAYFLDLMKAKGASISRQVVPDVRELQDTTGLEDPLAEEENSPVPNLTHRYPDRVLFLVSSECPIHCRFCTRKRKIGKIHQPGTTVLQEGIRYIREHREVRDVLLSGGDPLLLSDDLLEWILASIRSIRHVEIIRIGTRIPCALPQRVTARLARLLNKYRPLYVNIHFNHPDEITGASRAACGRLADAGIPLGSQTVLLRGINDDAAVILNLMKQLLVMRVRPYYLLQADLTRGTEHFRTPIETGLNIMRNLRGFVSGLAVPTYVVDLPGGGGKVPLYPGYLQHVEGKEAVFKNYLDREYRYPEPVIP